LESGKKWDKLNVQDQLPIKKQKLDVLKFLSNNTGKETKKKTFLIGEGLEPCAGVVTFLLIKDQQRKGVERRKVTVI